MTAVMPMVVMPMMSRAAVPAAVPAAVAMMSSSIALLALSLSIFLGQGLFKIF